MLHHELRPSKQHFQEGTPEFIDECVEKLKALGLKGSCLIRLDSGNDAEENFAHFGQESFIIKGNLRRECPEQWLATARRVGGSQKRHRPRQERLHSFLRSFLPRRSKVLNVPCCSCL